jgi:hypothetical protein
MTALQTACADIPGLTAATQQLHSRITDFLLEAQHAAASITGLPLPSDINPAALATAPVASCHATPAKHAGSGRAGGGTLRTQLLSPAATPFSTASAAVAAASGKQLLRSGLAISGPATAGVPGPQPTNASLPPGYYQQLMAAANAAAASSRSSPSKQVQLRRLEHTSALLIDFDEQRNHGYRLL